MSIADLAVIVVGFSLQGVAIAMAAIFIYEAIRKYRRKNGSEAQ